jgi:two-component system chemotaxis sensor kinase CheA
MREAFGVPQGVAQEIGEGGNAAPPGERAVAIGGGASKFLARFRDGARGRLATLREAVVGWDETPGSAPGAASLASAASDLGVEARAMGYEDVADLARVLHDRLATIAREELDPAPWRRALGAAIEGLGRLVAEKLGGPPSGMDLVAVRTELSSAPVEDDFAASVPVDAEEDAVRPAVAPRVRAADAVLGPKAPPPPPAEAGRPEETIRVSPEKLDQIAALASDLYFQSARAEDRLRRLRALLDVASRQARAAATVRHALLSGRHVAGGGEDAHEEMSAAVKALRRGLQEMLRVERDDSLRAGHAVLALRETVRDLQMLPVSTVFDLYPRLVRDLARQLGRQARLVVRGGDVELDRRVLEGLRDPLLHLLRNAVDHGIEPASERLAAGKPPLGTIVLVARPEGGSVVVEISDDGRGMDPGELRRAAVRKGFLRQGEADALSDEDAMELIFAPGFSSKEEVSDVSGRGVGMDVVKDRIQRLDGRIAISSEPGRGTRISLRLPLALSLARVLLVRAGGMLTGIPSGLVEDVLRVSEDEVRSAEGYEAIEWQGRTLPLASLARLLEREAAPRRPGRRTIAVVAIDEHLIGFVVDDLEGEREVVVRPLDALLGPLPHVAGATLLGTGQVVVVLNVPELVASTLGVSSVRLQAGAGAFEAPEPSRRARRLLVVDDSIIVRDMMKGVLEAAGFDVTLAVDGMDGLEKQLADAHDLVITDVEMPRMDGFELTRRLKRHAGHEEVPVIMVTTLDSPEARQKGLEAGASAYVVKNLLDMSSLVATIERLGG